MGSLNPLYASWDQMGGASGPMHVSELDEILSSGRIGLVSHRWYYSGLGELNGLPRGVATIVWGDPEPPEHMLETPTTPRSSYNVACPMIPEFRQMRQLQKPGSHNYGVNKPFENVGCWGWREILRKVVLARLVRPETVRTWLGEHEYDDLRRQIAGFPAYGAVKTPDDKIRVASHNADLRTRKPKPQQRGQFA